MSDETGNKKGFIAWIATAVVGLIGAIVTGLLTNTIQPVVGRLFLSPEESRHWIEASTAERDTRCQAISGYLNHHPDGAFADRAQKMLAARTVRQVERWEERISQSTILGSSNPSASQEAACQTAQNKASQEAEALCDVLRADSARYRNVVMEMAEEEQPCRCTNWARTSDEGDGGANREVWHCTLQPSFDCRFEELKQSAQEYCGE